MSPYNALLTITAHVKPVSFVSFSCSGELLATGGRVYIWSTASGKLFQELPRCGAEAVSCCWGDDQELFIGSGDGELHFFEHSRTHNRFDRNIKFHIDSRKQHIAALSLHGNRLVACTANAVHFWRVEGSASCSMYRIRHAPCGGVAYNTECSDRGDIRLWNLQTGRSTLIRHDDGTSSKQGGGVRLVQAVAARSTVDSHFLATACNSLHHNSIKVWKKTRGSASDDDVGLVVKVASFIVIALAIVCAVHPTAVVPELTEISVPLPSIQWEG
ncbi:hypothetical protein AURDEDRAFT_125295 [Auricularia subglabra TFB-10046 SS5]|nr:hypothetical protein AURDEDRAFT_125295 [Auricularia subglabra TFB-10046 SS5]